MRRDIVWPAALSPIMLSDCVTSVALPQNLIGSTVEAAAGIVAGKTAAGLVSVKVAALMEGVFDAMLLTKLKVAIVLLLGIVISFAGAGILLYPTEVASGDESAQPPREVSRYQQGENQTLSQAIKQDGPGPDKPKGPPKLDRAQIQGTWNLMVEKTEKSGSNVPASVKAFSMTFMGEQLVTKSKDPNGNEASEMGKFQLNQSTDPKTIAFNLGDDKFKGVYILLDDELIMAWTKAGEFQGNGAALLKFPWLFRRATKGDPDGAVNPLKGHTGLVRFAAFSPNGRTLATGALVVSPDRGERADEVILWDVTAHKLKHRVTLKSPVTLYQLAFSPDGKTLAMGTIGEIELLDVETGKVKQVLKGGHRYGTGVFSLAFSPDGIMLASGGSATEKTVRLWDLQTGELKRTLVGHNDEVVGLAFSLDGKTLASTGGSEDPTIRVWDVATGRLKLTAKKAKEDDFQSWQSLPLAFSPDGKILVKGRGAWVMFWDTQTGDAKDKLITPHAEGRILESLAFSPDGKLVAGGRQSGEIDVWETRPADGNFEWRAGDLKQTLKEHTSPVLALAFSPSGEVLASGDRDGTVRVRRLMK
jgi:uncharacterized protein (TIGR03067 family)